MVGKHDVVVAVERLNGEAAQVIRVEGRQFNHFDVEIVRLHGCCWWPRWRLRFCGSYALLDLRHVAHDSRCCSGWAITGRSGEGESRERPEVPTLDCVEETCFCRPAHRSMMILDEGSDAGEVVGSALVAHRPSG